MHDTELKKLLLETCPVRPGQEGRAWSALKEKLGRSPQARGEWSILSLPTVRGLAIAFVTVFVLPALVVIFFAPEHSQGLATADSQSPGVYATAFYSRSAKAQVVWLSGMDPAGDKPTYLDPTTSVSGAAGDPNSL